MPAKRTRVNALEIATTSKRPRVAARHRGTASQPVLVDTRPFSPSPPPPPLSPRQALVAAPQAPNFEATLRGSEHATVAASGAASEAVDEGFVWVEDKYDGFNWSRYPKHCKPPTSLSNRASWVYSHGYRIALRSNVAKSRGSATIAISTISISASTSSRRRQERSWLEASSKRTTVAPRKETLLERALQKGCSQAVANELTNFNIQEFRLAAVTWLVENNLPLSQFESSSFRNMIQLASVEAERALWASYNSVSRYVIRLYNYLLLKVVASLSESMSKVHISFDGWTTKGGKRGYRSGELRDLPIALPQLTGAHTGEAMAEVVMAIFKQFEITVGKLGYFVLDNAHNNNTTINTLALQMGFSATERRLRCGPHTLNLIGQMLLWGEEKESYDNEETERVNEAENMATWRGDGPLGVLLAVINYIKTPQQDQPVNAPTEQHKIKEPVKPVVTRWNSYVSCFERAVELQLAVNGYANYHIQKIETEDAPLKQATKRRRPRQKRCFGAIAEVIPDRLQSYEDVIHDEHTESPEDHLAINLRAALVKAREYYNKLDLSPAYYAATILHPRYKATLTQLRHNDIDDAINSFIEPAGLTENEEDEYEAWKRSEPIASEGVDPIKYWVGLRDRYPSLSKFAIDMLSIPGSSCECERLFSELGDLLEPRRRSISPQLLAAIQCDRRWIRAGFGSGEVPVKEAISDEEMDAKYANPSEPSELLASAQLAEQANWLSSLSLLIDICGRHGSQYFQVQPPDEDGPDVVPVDGAAAWAQVGEQMAKAWQDIERRAQTTIQEGERDEVNPWLERTQWLPYLVGMERPDLQEQQAEPVEAAIWAAMDGLARFSQASIIDRIGVFIRLEAIRTEMHQTRFQPLQPYMDKDAIVKHTTMAADPGQGEGPEPKKLSKIQKACLEFCIALLNHRITRREDGWKGRAVPADIVGGDQIARFMVVQKGLEMSGPDEDSGDETDDDLDDSAYESGPSQRRRPKGCLQLVQRMMDRFMVRGSHSPMQWMLDLRTYGLKIHYNTTTRGHVEWTNGDELLYKELHFSMAQFRGMLMFGSKAAPVPAVPWESIRDNPTDERPGWNFEGSSHKHARRRREVVI
ncbi:Dimer-Tnp-hAT domain containing protein [Pyrenophora tritici-repentis]|nr:Dimer-Tnp-hAT domain containing protein [Pyrenophora tritici-repentis]